MRLPLGGAKISVRHYKKIAADFGCGGGGENPRYALSSER